MAKSFADAFKEAEAAYAAKSTEKGTVEVSVEKRDASPAADDWALQLLGVTPLPADLRRRLRQGVVEVMAAPKLVTVDRGGARRVEVESLQPRPVLPAPVADGVKLVMAPGAELNWNGGQPVTASLLRQPAEMGRRAQLLSGKPASTREVVMGFDFGTSSAKVVLGDRGLKQAYAVPFRDAPSIDAFLLPARLYEDAGHYSLHGGPLVLNDLKLSLMADPDDATLQTRVVGYLALAIREARGWLFTTHAESYAKTQIVWTLALGQPADQATAGALTQLFQRLGGGLGGGRRRVGGHVELVHESTAQDGGRTSS